MKWILLYLISTIITVYSLGKLTSKEDFKRDYRELQRLKKQLILEVRHVLKLDQMLDWLEDKLSRD